MRRLATWGLLLVVGLGTASSVRAQEPARNAKPIAAMAWVVGGVWAADTSKLGGAMQRIETRYQWSDNGAYIRFNTHFVSSQGTLKNYDGNFYWEPTDKTLRVWYTDAGSAITQGPVTVAADQWQITFRGEDFEGKQADLRVDVAIKSKDLYHWTLNEKHGDSWTKLMELDYVRKPEA
jgi:hypothetical protein